MTVVRGTVNVKVSRKMAINPFLTNELSHRYHLGLSAFIIRDIRSEFEFLFTSSMNFL